MARKSVSPPPTTREEGLLTLTPKSSWNPSELYTLTSISSGTGLSCLGLPRLLISDTGAGLRTLSSSLSLVPTTHLFVSEKKLLPSHNELRTLTTLLNVNLIVSPRWILLRTGSTTGYPSRVGTSFSDTRDWDLIHSQYPLTGDSTSVPGTVPLTVDSQSLSWEVFWFFLKTLEIYSPSGSTGPRPNVGGDER